MKVQKTLLVAAERSGTHFLKSVLSGGREIRTTLEICNPSIDIIRTSEFSFLKFREVMCKENDDYFYPTQEIQRSLLSKYFANLDKICENKVKRVLLDVKYSHVHNFQPAWSEFVARPLLFDYAKETGLKLIHLIRRKPAHAVISGMLAQRRGVWHARGEQTVAPVRFKIERDLLLERTFQRRETIKLFRYWLKGLNVIEVIYEQLADPNSQVRSSLQEFLQLKAPLPLETEFRKATPEYSEFIENFDEIADIVDIDLDDAVDDGQFAFLRA
ncbi:MAG: hypothetical protein ACLPN5_17845 [Roseiarcus sp.]